MPSPQVPLASKNCPRNQPPFLNRRAFNPILPERVFHHPTSARGPNLPPGTGEIEAVVRFPIGAGPLEMLLWERVQHHASSHAAKPYVAAQRLPGAGPRPQPDRSLGAQRAGRRRPAVAADLEYSPSGGRRGGRPVCHTRHGCHVPAGRPQRRPEVAVAHIATEGTHHGRRVRPSHGGNGGRHG